MSVSPTPDMEAMGFQEGTADKSGRGRTGFIPTSTPSLCSAGESFVFPFIVDSHWNHSLFSTMKNLLLLNILWQNLVALMHLFQLFLCLLCHQLEYNLEALG